MNRDIESKDDIIIVVDRFYEKVYEDELLAPIFNWFVPDRHAKHLDKMYSFWNTTLFGEQDYKGNPLLKHFPIKKVFELYLDHFQRWLDLWEETIYEYHYGPVADDAVDKALKIGQRFIGALKLNDDKLDD